MFEAGQTNQDAAPNTDTDVAGQSEVSNEVETQDDESLLNTDSGDQSEQSDEENDEIEVDGKKFALPKSAAEKLKAERLMHADYTRKTQEVAEQRRVFENDVQRHRQESQQYIAEVARVVSIDEQLAEYNKLDWQALIDQEPQTAMKYQQQMRTLESKRNEAINALEQKRQQIALNEQQSIAKQAQDAEAYFAREIKGWSKERSNQLKDYGVAEGIPADVMAQTALKHPAFAKLLHKAQLYDQIAKKQTPAAAPLPQAKPAAKVGGNANANVKKDPSKMSDKEFAEYRRRVQSNRRK